MTRILEFFDMFTRLTFHGTLLGDLEKLPLPMPFSTQRKCRILDDYDYAVNCLRNLEGMLATRTPSRHLITAIAAHFATVRSLPLLVAVQDKLDYFHTLTTELCLL